MSRAVWATAKATGNRTGLSSLLPEGGPARVRDPTAGPPEGAPYFPYGNTHRPD